MSASREKKKRQELAKQGIAPKQLEAKARAKQRKKRAITWTVTLAIVALAVLAVVFWKVIWPNMAPKRTVAVKAGEHEITAAEMSYYYLDTVYQFVNTNGAYLSYLMDPSVPLDQQTYDEETGQSWADNFIDQAAKTAATYYAMADDAKAEGMSLTEDQQAQIDEQISTMHEAIESTDAYSSVNDYLSETYGPGCNESGYRSYLELQELAHAYSDKYLDSLSYTDDELEKVYDEDPNQYTNLTYRSFYVSKSYFETDTGTEEDTDTTDEDGEESEEEDAALLAAEAKANEMAKACQGDEQQFILWTRDIVPEDSQETYADDDATLCENYNHDSVSSYGSDWLYDSARKEGDTAAFAAGDAGYYVFYFISRNDNNYDTVSLRQIRLSAVADEDSDDDGTMDTVSDDQWNTLKSRAEELEQQWEDDGKTEDAFAEIAKTSSTDTASAEDGGLLENAMPSELSTAVSDWAYDDSRAAGDCEIVQGDDGYYLVYYVGKGRNCRLQMVWNDQQEQDYSDWYAEYQEKYEYTLEDGTKYLKTDLVLSES